MTTPSASEMAELLIPALEYAVARAEEATDNDTHPERCMVDGCKCGREERWQRYKKALAAARSYNFTAEEPKQLRQQLAEQAERIGELEKHSTAVARICEVNDQIAWGLVDLFDPELRGESPLLALKRLIPESLAQLTTLTAENRRLREALEFYAKEENWFSQSMVYCGDNSHERGAPASDGGERARTALAQPAATEGETR